MALYWGSTRTASAVDTRLKQINPNVVQEDDAPHVTERLVKGVARVTAQLVPPSPRNVRKLRRRLMQAGFMGENAGCGLHRDQGHLRRALSVGDDGDFDRHAAAARQFRLLCWC